MANHADPQGAAPDVELRRAVLDTVSRSERPLTMARLREALSPPQRRQPETLRRLLGELARERALFAVRVSGHDAYTARDPQRQVADAILRVLEDGPLSRSQVDEKVAREAKGLGQTVRQHVFADLVARKQIFEHPPIGRYRVRFGRTPPDPGLYLAAPVAMLREVERRLRACGVSEEMWKTALARALGLSGSDRSQPELATLSSDRGQGGAAENMGREDEQSVFSAIVELTAQEGSGALLSIRRLRAMRRLGKERFDRAMLRLAAAGRIMLHHHDFPHSLPPEEQSDLVQDDRGVYYVGAALRRQP